MTIRCLSCVRAIAHLFHCSQPDRLETTSSPMISSSLHNSATRSPLRKFSSRPRSAAKAQYEARPSCSSQHMQWTVGIMYTINRAHIHVAGFPRNHRCANRNHTPFGYTLKRTLDANGEFSKYSSALPRRRHTHRDRRTRPYAPLRSSPNPVPSPSSPSSCGAAGCGQPARPMTRTLTYL